MLKITYQHYLKYEEFRKQKEEYLLNKKENCCTEDKKEKNLYLIVDEQQNQYLTVKEESEEYIYDKNNEHDKVIREILMKKEEALNLINKALKPKEEIKEPIELYSNRFITSKYQDRESDIIYKIKDKNIFFLIEHQSTIDYSIAYRMLEYSIEIMRGIIDKKKSKSKTYKYPLIIPIIIYTGEAKWDAKLSMKELKEQIEWYEEKEEISLVDVNKYTKEELLQEDNILSKVMLLEKSKNTIEFIKNVEEILQTSNNKNLEKIKDIIRYKAEGIIEHEQLETILKKVKIEKEEETMTLAERIHENERKERLEIRLQAMREGEIKGEKRGEMTGKLETINFTIRKMLGLKLEDKIIQEVTGVKQKEIEKIKKELAESR